MEVDQIEEIDQDTALEDEIRNAIAGGEVKQDGVTEEVTQEAGEEASAAPENSDAEQEAAESKKQEEAIEPPPAGLSGAIKAKWNELPADVRAEWAKRENDIHQMVTRHDGELNMGRKMKEVITPYMPLIQAANSTPEKTISQLMNTAYVLATGSPAQKAQILQSVAQQYDVDLGLATQTQNNVDPNIMAMRQELEYLRAQLNPDTIKNQLQEQMAYDNMMTEINAFAANPSNRYFEQVRPIMGSLMESGKAKNLQEAYEMAIYADPTIRSTLIAEQTAELEAKRKKEISAKKSAAVSVSGSPDLTSPRSKTQDLSLEDELLMHMNASKGII